MKIPHLLPLALLLILSTAAVMAGLVSASSTNITTDQLALLSFKSHMNLDPSHTLSINWSDSSTTVCNWIGITCDFRHNRVTRIDISTMRVKGNLPPELGNLSFLSYIDLNGNNFYGSLPEELTRLRRLKLMDFSVNNLEGNIPPWLSLFPALQFLSLGNNSFTGSIPSSLSNMSKLENMDLQFNNLQGIIPKEIGGLLSLKTFRLSHNQLSGSIPSGLFNISNMERLYLDGNSFYGNLPNSICADGLARLEILHVGRNNGLYGEIPRNLSNCLRLRALILIRNKFSGSIPREIGKLGRLEALFLGDNNLKGEIPADLSNITMLEMLDLSQNHFTGAISEKTLNISSLQFIDLSRNNISGMLPPDICFHLKQLQVAYLSENNLVGEIPRRLYECSSLTVLDLDGNKLSGSIPREIGNSTNLQIFGVASNKLTGVIPQEVANLYNLNELYLGMNSISGSIPTFVFNMSMLRRLALERNQLGGNLPSDMGHGLPNLEVLNLLGNNLSVASSELSFITSLSNCRYLNFLGFQRNPMYAELPTSIGNLSKSLQNLYVNDCGLRGSIPNEIGNLSNLIMLSLGENDFTGSLPSTLANVRGLQRLFIGDTRINGTIPINICELENLETLVLGGNEISGSIPPCIGNITTLRYLDLQSNKLDSNIPPSLWQLTDALQLILSSNFLIGYLSVNIGNLKAANLIDLSHNQLSGIIPDTIGDLQILSTLNLSNNRLEGPIPESIGRIVNLISLDLSLNNFSGMIPLSLENLVNLKYLNVSFNHLSGEIPSHGPFMNFTSQSFMFNNRLCGDPRYNVTSCHNTVASKRNLRIQVILIVMGIIAFLIVIMIFSYIFMRNQKKNRASTNSELWLGTTVSRISYYELLEATDGYSESNLIGSGSFGSVYHGVLRSGKVVAVKVFHVQRERAFDSFIVECEVLRNLRHKNLCKVISCCSNENFKALVLEYMPSGSLEKLLYSHNLYLDLIQRISIMIDVASALEYLHHGYSTHVIHCDIKPSNVLVDENMVAYLCDFGVAKLLGDGETSVQTITLATLGYIAPEFGADGRLSIECDIYSYGIMLLEVFTRMKPSDESFIGNLSLRSWVMDSMPNGITHIIDSNLLEQEEECSSLKLNCLRSIMNLALHCSSTSPHDRISIKNVTVSLKKIKNELIVGRAYDG